MPDFASSPANGPEAWEAARAAALEQRLAALRQRRRDADTQAALAQEAFAPPGDISIAWLLTMIHDRLCELLEATYRDQHAGGMSV